MVRFAVMAALLCVGALAAADTPNKAGAPTSIPTEAELKAPWDKLDLSLHDADKVYASVGTKQQKQAGCDRPGGLTDGLCWTTYTGIGRWRAGIATTNEAARKKLLGAWGAGEVRDEGDEKSTYWFLRAGEHHYIAHWNGKTEYPIEISELTSLAQVVEISKSLVGKTRDDIVSAGGDSVTGCEKDRPTCVLDYSINEISTVTTQVTATLEGGSAKSVGARFMVPGVPVATVRARIEAAVGRATVHACKGKLAGTTELTFKSSPTTLVWFESKSPRTVEMCVGACDPPCK